MFAKFLRELPGCIAHATMAKCVTRKQVCRKQCMEVTSQVMSNHKYMYEGRVHVHAYVAIARHVYTYMYVVARLFVFRS